MGILIDELQAIYSEAQGLAHKANYALWDQLQERFVAVARDLPNHMEAATTAIKHEVRRAHSTEPNVARFNIEYNVAVTDAREIRSILLCVPLRMRQRSAGVWEVATLAGSWHTVDTDPHDTQVNSTGRDALAREVAQALKTLVREKATGDR